jgi:PKD repeat protein
MKHVFTFLLSTLILQCIGVFPNIICAQSIKLNTVPTSVKITENTYQKIAFSSAVSELGTMEVSTPEGLFTVLSVAGFGLRNRIGEPALPVYRQLVEVPFDASFKIKILKQHFQDIDLTEAGIGKPVMPAQPPMSKSDDPTKVHFAYEKRIYTADKTIEDAFVTITPVGVMRALNLARIEISPVQYNPVQKKLRVYDLLEIEIVFENADIAKTIGLKQAKASPYFNSMYQVVGNYKTPSTTNGLITSAPATYVVVSDPMFQSALQPFIQWKTRKGFKVIEAYTNNPSVGTTTTSIKTYLQGLYNSPPSGYSSPSFVLFVGDVAQIPAWSGSAGSHYTDLRYCEYTGDNLPEVFYGRFSATNTAQLQPQIDKTLEYEQYLMPDPSFLNEAVMVAGADGSYQTHSNGQINYGTETYFNAAHNILSHTYLQPEPSGAGYSQSIKANVSSGVAYANYTAHCSPDGWADPSFVSSDIASLTNAHKYCLMVGNCCLSAKFDVNSFAEEQLRAANKGAIGYIGGSNSTYWDEDYWWGCGFKTVALHPVYDANHIGAYDGTFHDHGEPTADWFVTQGQMVVCGNYAVEESNSSRKTYYWEIYHLMGDPSLMVYYSVPPPLIASYPTTLMIGMTTLAVNTEAYATVALSYSGVLLDAKVADASGTANLSFTALAAPGNLDIVITKQNRQPHIGTIQVIPASGPYIVYSGSSISDPLPDGNNNGIMDYGETDLLTMSLKNVGIATAGNVITTLSTTDSYVTITDNSENYGNVLPDEIVSRADAFSFNVADNIPDQHVVTFDLSATNGIDIWVSHFNYTANAPQLTIGAMTVQDNGAGWNNNGILDPGETANLVIDCSNSGHSAVSDVNGTLSITGGSSPFLSLNNSTSLVGNLASGNTGNAIFNVTASAATPIGTPVDLQFSLSGGGSAQYSVQEQKQVVIGLIPTYTIANSTVTTCVGNFYDPGGASAEYSNGQDYTMVFNPGSVGNMMKFAFTSFSLEASSTCAYDYLKIYNGNSISSPLIGTYCGTNSPGTVIANNSSGSLTFVFHSDVSVTSSGWDASISCHSTSIPPVAAFTSSSLSPSVNTTVVFTDQSSNIPTSWNWGISPGTYVFLNGTNQNSQNPQLQFTASGPYTVSLTSANAFGSNTLVKTNYINVINCTVSSFPWNEGFENSGNIPSCWQQEQVNSSGINWTFITGNGGGNPATAHTGNYNACLKDNSSADNKTMLILPMLDLSLLGNPVLKFWHTQAYWSPDQDLLTVYYRNNSGGAWTTLSTYSNNITAWTEETILLPSPTSTYSIALEGNAKYGYGVCLDDISVTGVQSKTLNLTVFLEGLFNGIDMNKAQNSSGNQFPGSVADQISVELHNSTAPYALAGGPYTIELNTDGTAAATIPGSLNASYYVVVKHRNSIETWSNSPVSFSGPSVDYNFSTAANMAHGNNLKLVSEKYVIYSGDINQDGNINTDDIFLIGNDAFGFMSGYTSCDVNGDGMIDSEDLICTDNNASVFVGCIKP